MIRRASPAGVGLLAACLALPLAPAARAADAPPPAEVRMRECLTAAAEAHRLPPAMLVILLKVEGGTPGRVSRNTNDTADLGPMQVNTIWVPKMAARWRTTPAAAYAALRDDLCANLEGGAWILRQALDEARGDFWTGVGIYHSHNPAHKERYLRKVLDWTRRLQAQARRTAGQPPPTSAPADAPRAGAVPGARLASRD